MATLSTSSSATGTVGMCVTFKIKADREAEAIAFLSEVAAGIEAEEPNVLSYHFFRAPDDRHQIIVMEIYKDQATLDAHNQWLGSKRAKMMELLDMSTFRVLAQTGEWVKGFVR